VKRSKLESMAHANAQDSCTIGWTMMDHYNFQRTPGDKTPRPHMLVAYPNYRHKRHVVWWPLGMHPTKQLEERYVTIAHHAPRAHEGTCPTDCTARSPMWWQDGPDRNFVNNTVYRSE
jgi:hypothetical protein